MSWEASLFIGAALAVSLGCLVPNRWLPPLPNDKLMHALAFALLAGLAIRMADDRFDAMLWMAGLVVAGWVIECVQQLVPDRRFCWRDIAANTGGVAFAGACALLYAGL